MEPTAFVGDFRSVPPAHALKQAESLAWLAEAHTRAQTTLAERGQLGGIGKQTFDADEFRRMIRRHLDRFGCDERQIGHRGHELADCGHTDWTDMTVYRLHQQPVGEGMSVRTRVYGTLADNVLGRLYPADHPPPANLVHVTCTGYESPSAAQRLVTTRGWGQRTRVTHAYHMGCYAALPVLRIASGLAAIERDPGSAAADVVHIELCSLHLNPALHTPEQMVIQTLFADGFIAYTVSTRPGRGSGSPNFAVLAWAEEILPSSCDAMTWTCADFGMQMSLTREVPARIGAGLVDFVALLCERGCLREEERKMAIFAVHPGGPRILDIVRERLRLDEDQLRFSRRVLLARGNMSSATLPHIWMAVARDNTAANGSAVISLAFGPGLTLSGAVLRKVSS